MVLVGPRICTNHFVIGEIAISYMDRNPNLSKWNEGDKRFSQKQIAIPTLDIKTPKLSNGSDEIDELCWITLKKWIHWSNRLNKINDLFKND